MINKQWRKRMAVLLAMGMLAAHMPAGAAQETSDAKAVSEETGSVSESQGSAAKADASQADSPENNGKQAQEVAAENSGKQAQEAAAENSGKQAQEAAAENTGGQAQEAAAENSGKQEQEAAAESAGGQTQEVPAESTDDQAQVSSGQNAGDAAGSVQEAAGSQAESTDVSSAAQESTQGEAAPAPAQESAQNEVAPAPAQESAQGEAAPAPAQESGQSEVTPTPVQESAQSEVTPAPAQESAQNEVAPAPAQESAQNEVAPAPAQESAQSEGGETTPQEAGTPEAVPGTQEEAGNGNEEEKAEQQEAGNGPSEEKTTQEETANKADEEEKIQQAAENENAVDETQQQAQTAQENADGAAGSEGTSGEDAAAGQKTAEQNTAGQDAAGQNATGQDATDQNGAGQNAGGAGQAADTVPAGTSVQNNAKVSVSWKDDNDANDVRPGFMTVYLQTSEDGENYDDGTAYELNEKNNWQILLENLPTTKDGKQLHYRWVWDVDLVPGIPPEDQDEYNLVGYTRTRNDDSEDHLQSTREYTHITAKEKYTISIDWDDRGDETAKRPKKLDVTLPDGRVVTLTAKNGWKMDVEMPVVHRDLTWKIGAADGWVSGGSSTDFTEERTQITFTRKWKTKKDKETIETEEVVEEPAGYSTLTVQYWIGSESAAPSFTGVYENGQNYSVVVPRKTGYRTQVTKVKGTISEDTVINVRYIPNSYTVTVYYRYLNGETAAATTQQELLTGSTFDIASPAVNGYAVSAGSISGTVTGRDLTYVVYYTGIVPDNNNGEGRQNEQMIPVAGTATAPAAQQPDTGETEIDEYRTPLGLGEVGINAGECFE